MPRKDLVALSERATRRVRSTLPLALAAAALCLPGALAAPEKNGFDLADATIPTDEILAGGPPRDGIPALDDPRHVAPREAPWLDDDDRVLGVSLGGEARAYPVSILNWHEVVNDVVGDRPIVVSYCPLCRSGVVFDARVDGERRRFGVSGLLYNSDVLLYERKSESLLSQLHFGFVSGPLAGDEIEVLPARETTWAAWRERHPETRVMARPRGSGRDYARDPYTRYHASERTMFPVRGADDSRGAKTWAWLVLDGADKLLVAEPTLRELLDGPKARLALDDGALVLSYDEGARELSAARGDRALRVIPAYWFALTAFHPDAQRVDAEEIEVLEGR